LILNSDRSPIYSSGNRSATIRIKARKPSNYENAIVSAPKIVNYLLSLTHPDGRSKAQFFLSFGFSPDNWQELASALLAHAANHEATKLELSPFGTRYISEGAIVTPDGRTPQICSIWFIATGEIIPALVSAYPLKSKD
jgi:hypothetical protein